MLRLSRLLAVLLPGWAFLAPWAAGQADPFLLEASLVVPLSNVPRTRVTIESDGATTITQDGRGGQPSLVLRFRLTPEELSGAKEAVLASRFFEEWGPGVPALDAARWDITVLLGEHERRRDGLHRRPEFEPLERHLFRFVHQAQATAEIRRGEFASIFLHEPIAEAVTHPAALGPEIVASTWMEVGTVTSGEPEKTLSLPP